MHFLEFSNQAKKFLKGLDNSIIERILKRIEKLKQEAVPSDAKFIGRENNDKIFRYRIGNYRILYKIKEQEKNILIVKIDKREKVYDK